MYRQIAVLISMEIEKGDYPPNRPVPSEAELCDRFSVSRRTARSAYDLLAEHGWIVRAPGKGTYAAATPGTPLGNQPPTPHDSQG
ncbi:winged helix-turn-helix domain-containing protein [Spiractinospora alimapuensis]|uniref:winged helix-turn-helix domain-containing protein n=1 Tax=Spiractinospora alimapuensis TaxID=2820884 RepID=UPI002ED6E109